MKLYHYQREHRADKRAIELEPVNAIVIYRRRFTSRQGARKLHHLIKPELEEKGIKLGRDGLFDYLREAGLLVKPKRSYTKTTFSRHWLRKHPNLLQGVSADRPEKVFGVTLPIWKVMRECIIYL
jgi:putative transposase